ncbi:MAG: hypothetical protein ONB31_04435 [candidate division KSB1 bacterium]|nr:hypothetical protein [candidate division KSB1 bacterium]MDZ7336443.1 hypothetical protein [candidate division KSB1 bacterium]MDZ7357146.1 hypothetical protein [candidate division KSB1 bacterium]MDZ7400214.1 hypothetical protein [candidate division KSB1 bacterium]
MKRARTKKILALGGMIILLMGLTTCEKEPTKPVAVAPDLPPVESLQADLSFFKLNSNSTLNKATLSKSNFFAAVFRVSAINLTVLAASAVPTAVLTAALTQPAELKSDGKWHWIFHASEGPLTFSVDLAGWIDTQNGEAVWEAYISSNAHLPPLEHFLWFEGRAKISNKEGWWTFYDHQSPDSLIATLKVEWDLSDENDRELTFTRVKVGCKNYGDYLKYGIELTDHFLIYYDASTNRTNTIYWNSETRAGYIEWFDYNNGQKSYWDEYFNDISGPPA